MSPAQLVLIVIGAFLILAQHGLAADIVVNGAHGTASDHNAGTADAPLRTIVEAARRARAGDRVIVRAGTYREAVPLEHSGTAEAPITFLADPIGSVLITGADVINGFERVEGDEPIYAVAWDHVFAIDHDEQGRAVEHHPSDAPLWGRAEQVIVDGMQLLPFESLAALRMVDLPPAPPVRNLGEPFTGAFAVDTATKRLYVRLNDGSDPNDHTVEAATRGLLFGTNPWIRPDGVSHVHVKGFIFRYGATFPQRAAVWLHGRDNLLEDCLIEQMAGSGANISGTMRRCVLRNNGHTGGGATGDGLVNESSLWVGNSWKPIDRNWEAAGQKIALCDGGTYRHCAFVGNGGPGLWLDIDVRNVVIADCVFDANEGSGLFIEISRDVTAVRNLATRNGTGVVGDRSEAAWSVGGIQLGESRDCVISFNTCRGNKDGITIREQGPRTFEGLGDEEVTYHNTGHVITHNLLAGNAGYAIGLWYDNAFFGPHPSERDEYPTEEAWEAHVEALGTAYDPREQGMVIEHNGYDVLDGRPVALVGVPWRRGHAEHLTVGQFTDATGFEARAGTFEDMHAGWADAPEDVEAWVREELALPILPAAAEHGTVLPRRP